MNFTENNYITSKGHGKNFKVKILPPKNINANFHEESKKVAEMIWSKKQGNINLMYSGGIDSEYVLGVFLEMKMKVTPIIIKLNPGYNEHDVKYAFEYCESKKLKPKVIDLDFDKFVSSGEILDIASQVKCGLYQLPSTYKIIEQLDGTIVMGSHGPPHLTKNEENNLWYITEHEPIHTVLKWFKKKDIFGFPFFLVYTPEQYISFVRHPLMINLVQNRIPGKLGNNSTKWMVFNDFSGYRSVQRPKFTGYENIENSNIFQHENMQTIVSWKRKYYGQYKEEYNAFINRMSII